MARARNLKPSFFTNDELAECSVLARLLFAGLWTLADREGRLEDRPKKIKAELLPYDDCDCNELAAELHGKKFIVRYEVNGNRYIEISNFKKHQNPHPKEPASVIPPIPYFEFKPAENCEAVEINDESRNYRNEPGLFLTTSSPIPHPEEERTPIGVPKKTRASANGTRLPEDWSPSDEDRQFAISQGLGGPITSVQADKFRDYWRGVAGAKGRKLDWPATWRNWIRKYLEDQGNQNAKTGRQPTFTERLNNAADQAERDILAEWERTGYVPPEADTGPAYPELPGVQPVRQIGGNG